MTDKIIENKQSIWTIEAFIEHTRILQVQDKVYQTMLEQKNKEFADERDLRYKNTNDEKEKALKIKEVADLAALELARESQKYKEERNDAQREQVLTERGAYVTRDDLAEAIAGIAKELKPVITFINNHDGNEKGSQITTGKLISIIGVTGVIVGIVSTIIANFAII